MSVDEHVDHLGVAPWPRIAEDLGAELVKLPVPSALGTLRAKHRPRVPPARHRLTGLHPVLDVGARGSRGPLRAKGQSFVVVFEGVHLLFDHLGRLTDGPHEERGRFHVGRSHLAEAIQVQRARIHLLHALPASDLVGEHIVHPFDGSKRGHGAGRGLIASGTRPGQEDYHAGGPAGVALIGPW